MLWYCKAAMREVCGDFTAELRDFKGEDDHEYLLVEYPPEIAIFARVNSIKGLSAWQLQAQVLRHG